GCERGLGDSEVVAERLQMGLVELDTGVDAVIAGAVRRQSSAVGRVHHVERQPRRGCLGGARLGAGQAAVVEVDAYGSIVGHRHVGLELVDRGIRVVVDLDGGCPRSPAVIGGGQERVGAAGAVILVRHVQRVFAVPAGFGVYIDVVGDVLTGRCFGVVVHE